MLLFFIEVMVSGDRILSGDRHHMAGSHGNQFSETLQKRRKKPPARAQSQDSHKPNPYEKLWPLSRKWQVSKGRRPLVASSALLN
jgi:hypothetical protein